jgi:phosphoribosyl-ATP pyrophosphohydrolase
VAAEAADVIYHLLVALRSRGVSLDQVGKVLEARQARSGLEEKAGRPKG